VVYFALARIDRAAFVCSRFKARPTYLSPPGRIGPEQDPAIRGETHREGFFLASYARDPRAYELMVILLPDLADEDLTGAIDRVSGYITDVTGSIKEILTDSPWGRRRLAYSIRFNSQDYRDGMYVIWHFDLEPSRMTEIERELKLDVRVIRYLVVHDDPRWGSPNEGNQPPPGDDSGERRPGRDGERRPGRDGERRPTPMGERRPPRETPVRAEPATAKSVPVSAASLTAADSAATESTPNGAAATTDDTTAGIAERATTDDTVAQAGETLTTEDTVSTTDETVATSEDTVATNDEVDSNIEDVAGESDPEADSPVPETAAVTEVTADEAIEEPVIVEPAAGPEEVSSETESTEADAVKKE